jgi:ribosomal protein L30/L7E
VRQRRTTAFTSRASLSLRSSFVSRGLSSQPTSYHSILKLDSINKIDPKKRKTLQLLRLLQINNGVFIKLTKATTEMLKSESGTPNNTNSY